MDCNDSSYYTPNSGSGMTSSGSSIHTDRASGSSIYADCNSGSSITENTSRIIQTTIRLNLSSVVGDIKRNRQRNSQSHTNPNPTPLSRANNLGDESFGKSGAKTMGRHDVSRFYEATRQIMQTRDEVVITSPPPETIKTPSLISKCGQSILALAFRPKIKNAAAKATREHAFLSESLKGLWVEERLNDYILNLIIPALHKKIGILDQLKMMEISLMIQDYVDVIFQSVTQTDLLIAPILNRLRSLEAYLEHDFKEKLAADIRKCAYQEVVLPRARSFNFTTQLKREKSREVFVATPSHAISDRSLTIRGDTEFSLTTKSKKGLLYFLDLLEKNDKNFLICVENVLEGNCWREFAAQLRYYVSSAGRERIEATVRKIILDYITTSLLTEANYPWNGLDQEGIYIPFKRVPWDEALRRFKPGIDPNITIIVGEKIVQLPQAGDEALRSDILKFFLSELVSCGLLRERVGCVCEKPLIDQILTFIVLLSVHVVSAQSIWEISQRIALLDDHHHWNDVEVLMQMELTGSTSTVALAREELITKFKEFKSLSLEQKNAIKALTIAFADILLMCSACGFMRAGWYIHNYLPTLLSEHCFKISHDTRACIVLKGDPQYAVCYQLSLSNQLGTLNSGMWRLIDANWCLMPFPEQNNGYAEWCGTLSMSLPTQFLGTNPEDVLFSWKIHKFLSESR